MNLERIKEVVLNNMPFHTHDFVCIGYGRNDSLSDYLGIPYKEIHCDTKSFGDKNAGWHGGDAKRLYYITRNYFNTLEQPTQTTTMDKTYAEETGNDTFNWNAFLKRATNNRDTVTLKECDAAVARAAKWTTCACGNQCNIIPRHHSGMPKDAQLAKLGKEFYNDIKAFLFSNAKCTLGRIEVLSAKLIEEEKEKLRQEEAAIKAARELLVSKGYFVSKQLSDNESTI